MDHDVPISVEKKLCLQICLLLTLASPAFGHETLRSKKEITSYDSHVCTAFLGPAINLNEPWKRLNSRLNSNIDQGEFDQLIQKFNNLYRPIVQSHGAMLKILGKWESDQVNANANRRDQENLTSKSRDPVEKVWNVTIHGGIARRPEVNLDGLSLVICHELGHHLGGYPFMFGDWSANEGQADYFATQNCARKIWAEDQESNLAYGLQLKPTLRELCIQKHSDDFERGICFRTMAALDSMADLLGYLRDSDEVLSYQTPDTNQVRTTSPLHPKSQCRMDTFYAGASCPILFNPLVIPGIDLQDRNSREAEIIASKYICTTTNQNQDTYRPRCWYAPKIKLAPQLKRVQIEQNAGDQNPSIDPGESFDLYLPVKNSTSDLVDDLSSSISFTSQDGLETSRSVFFEPIEPRKTKSSRDPMSLRVPSDHICGEPLFLNLQLHSRFADRFPFQLSVPTGRFVSVFDEEVSFDGGQGVEIPDHSEVGVKSNLFVDFSSEGTHKIKISVQVEHPYVGDLEIILIEPSGRKHTLKRLYEGGSAQQLDQIYSVDAHRRLIKGQWTFEVRDLSPNDVGTIKSWRLTVQNATCGDEKIDF